MIQLNGKFIGVREKTSVFTLEKVFVAVSCEKAALRVTALGLYFAEVNGKRVGDAYLTPGWTSYNKMLQVQEYDVTELLCVGENVLSLTVGEGWYRGAVGYEKRRNGYGKRSAVCADLVLSDKIVSTDESWIAHESHIRESGIYDGETQDFTAKLKTLTPCEAKHDKKTLVQQICEPVRNIEHIAVKKLIRTSNGELVYDFGQNMAGVVEIKTPDYFKETLTLRFAEILVNGYFDTACRVLMNNDYPGWLYEVDMGATTIWERWNGLMPDGTPDPDGMNSYNHYAYGSVMEFVYRRIAGIEPIEAGFRKIKVAPRPCVGLDALTAEYCSVSGKIVSGYERKNGEVIYRIEIPDGVSAEIVLPDKQTKDVGGGIYEFVI